jgi:hypothetical protein
LEASLDHFWVAPPSHFAPQKVRGLVVGFAYYERDDVAAGVLSRGVNSEVNFSLDNQLAQEYFPLELSA